jgi:hypothetical protein
VSAVPLLLHPQLTFSVVLFVLAVLALVFVVLPGLVGLWYYRRRGGR